MDMPPLPDLVDAAIQFGASFEIADDKVNVKNVSAIPNDIRDHLKQRRDELYSYLVEGQGVPEGPSAAILREAGVHIEVATTTTEAEELLSEILSDAGDGPIGLDLETAPKPNQHKSEHTNTKLGLDPLRADPRLVQLYAGGELCAVFDMRSISWAVFAELWSHRLIIHNAQFELAFFAVRGIYPQAFECTLQAAGLMLGVHRRGLASAADVYLDWQLPKDLQTSDWGADELSRNQLTYAALDAVAAYKLWPRLEADLKSCDRWQAYVLQRDAVPAAVEMGIIGVGFDVSALNEEINKWSLELADARREWHDLTESAPPQTPAGIRNWLEVNLDAETLAAWPRTKNTQQLSTARGDLERAAHLPAIRPLLRIKALEKLLNSFGPSLRDARHPVTGRIHPNFNVAGTKSGRWSCRRPNMQQMPGAHLAPGFRRVFTAALGNILVAADYSQMELRAAAEVSGDPALREVFDKGIDLHRLTAAETAGITLEEVTKDQRAQAKPVNFGSIFGMGPGGLAAAAWNGYRIELSERDAQKALSAFFRKFRVLKGWMRSHADTCKTKRRIEIGAGRVVEASWEANGLRYTQCCNLPIQGACADVMMRAVARIHRHLRLNQPGAHLTAQIHDELIIECPTDAADEVVAILREEMVAAFLETFPDAPTSGLVDVKTGQNWAELK